jgi:hypothetical protein
VAKMFRHNIMVVSSVIMLSACCDSVFGTIAAGDEQGVGQHGDNMKPVQAVATSSRSSLLGRNSPSYILYHTCLITAGVRTVARKSTILYVDISFVPLPISIGLLFLPGCLGQGTTPDVFVHG